jgi:membrane protease YdiL (CAAX protease family)
MSNTLNNLIQYLKNPVLEKDKNTNFIYRLKTLIFLVFICIFTTFAITIITSIVEVTGLLNIKGHSITDALKSSSTTRFFLLAVVFAPLTEELIFRAPLTLIKKKKYFKTGFYAIALLFGYIHISNYELNTSVILFSPLLIAPQFFVGLYLGYIRVKFGLLWSIALHASYNGFLLSIYLLAKDAITQI